MALTAAALVSLSDYQDGIELQLVAAQMRDRTKRHATIVFPRDQPRPRGRILASLVDYFVIERKFVVEVKDDETRLEFDWSHIKTKEEKAPRPRLAPPKAAKPEKEEIEDEDASVCDYDDCEAAPEHESGPARFCEEHRCKSCPAGVIHKMQNRGQTLCYACANKKTPVPVNLCSFGGELACKNPAIHHVSRGVPIYFCEAHRCKHCPPRTPPRKMAAHVGDGTFCQTCWRARCAKNQAPRRKRARDEKEEKKSSAISAEEASDGEKEPSLVSAEEISIDVGEDEIPTAKRPRVDA